MIARSPSKRFSRVTCKPIQKFWSEGSLTSKKCQKTGLWNVADVYLKTSKNQTKGDTDPKYGSK